MATEVNAGVVLEASPTPKSLFSRGTAERLDNVRKYLGKPGGKPKPRVRGRQNTKAALQELGLVADGQWPRNLPAYHVIQTAFPDFDWKRGESAEGRRWVEFSHYPTVEAQSPSLADLSIESMRATIAPGAPAHIQVDLLAPNIQRRFKPLLEIGHDGIELTRVLVDLPTSYPPMQVVEAVAWWWRRALSGEPSTIATPVCPDYATCDSGDPMRPIMYTFDGLNDGIGLVAKRALGALPKLWEFLKVRNMRNVRFVVALADSEADTQSNLDRVGLDHEEFVARLRNSQRAFAQACPPDMPVETPLLTQIDRTAWEMLLKQAREAVARGYWGALELSEEDKTLIAESRRSLLERWYGRSVDIRAIFESQIPEYLAVGDLFRHAFPNVLMLGADGVAMSPFSQGLPEGIKPVLFLRNVDY